MVPLETQDTVSVVPLVSLIDAVDEVEMEAETDKTLLSLVLEDQMLQERLERQQQKDEYICAILILPDLGNLKVARCQIECGMTK